MTAAVSDALAAQRRLQGNVGFQGLLERLTAQILSSLT
jgi:DNA polymerase-3 subunit delta'